MELEKLIEILEASVIKHGGGQPLTLSHLLNIVKKAQRELEQEADDEDEQHPGWHDGWGDRD